MSYDEFTADLARYPKSQDNPQVVEAMYCGLGLVGEAGETADKIKKWHRDGVVDQQAIAYELGDVLYYLTRLANVFGYTIEQIKDMNIQKLTDRRKRNTIHGSGDNR